METRCPVLMARDPHGATVSAILPAVSAASLQAVFCSQSFDLGTLLLVTDAAPVYPPCAAAMGVSHEALTKPLASVSGYELHIPDRQQPP